MTDGTQPDAGKGFDNPWAPPESKTSLEKGAQQPPVQDHIPGQPAPQQPPVQPQAVHDHETVTSMPTPGFGPPVPPPAQAPAGAAVPPPPVAPSGPGMGAPQAPGGYGYPGYPQGYGWSGMPTPPRNNMGVTAMVLGIVSCCVFCIYGVFSVVLGVVAVVLGVKGKKLADRGEATNRGQAQTGFITGIIGIVLGLAVITSLIVAFVMATSRQDTTFAPYDNPAPGASVSVTQA
ncbi:DUF4190 domain-containing protein [Streptomyces sp. NBC_00820]|uniref:DUF4190 domain-containing protein n=1 Tax=Streptomyces sp. NBC_00820 TaxID=2975842 RepID=UPI002ED12244|nr:DUF4190 domain-containing protein [Streptomyces sp. NBC_00820]